MLSVEYYHLTLNIDNIHTFTKCKCYVLNLTGLKYVTIEPFLGNYVCNAVTKWYHFFI